jgi:hypothetical protein
MRSETLPALNKLIIMCTVHYIIHLQCTFSYSLSLVHMRVRDCDILAWVRGQRKMSRVLGAFGLLDFTVLWPILGAHFETYEWFFFPGCSKPRILNQWIWEHNCITFLFQKEIKTNVSSPFVVCVNVCVCVCFI